MCKSMAFKWGRAYATERVDCSVDGRYVGHIAGRRRDGGIDYIHCRWNCDGFVDQYWRLENSPQLWTIWIPERDERGFYVGECATDYRDYPDEESAMKALEAALRE